MPGIEIISKTSTLVPADWAHPVCDIIGIITIVSMILGAILIIAQDNIFLDIIGKIFRTICCISFFALLTVGLASQTIYAEPSGHYIYEAYVEEGVDMAEFFDKYEFVSVDDDNVYTFKDKITERSAAQ